MWSAGRPALYRRAERHERLTQRFALCVRAKHAPYDSMQDAREPVGAWAFNLPAPRGAEGAPSGPSRPGDMPEAMACVRVGQPALNSSKPGV